MKQALRKSGIDIIGDAPWGTHFCQFYHTKEDLIDILVPYFKAGLENNEFCMWVTSEPLSVEEAQKAMTKAVPNFGRYLESGQIEIIPHTEWYLKGGSFNQERVLNGWVEKLNQALAKGYEGLRLTGNTFWLERNHWKAFAEYEAVVNSVIGNYKMIAICTYSLDKCGASEVIDVVSTHQFALIKREGRWGLIESSERKLTEQALRENEERLNRSQEIAHLGSWELDLINNVLTWSDEVYRIFGLEPQEFDATYEAFLDAVHPDDRAAVDEAFSGSLRAGRDGYEIEHRVVRKSNGEVRVVHEKCQHYRDETGRIVRSMGMVHDITERKKAEAEIAHLASFPQLNPNAVLELDRTGNIKYLNPAAKTSFPDLSTKGSRHPFLAGWEDMVKKLSATKRRSLTREVKVGDSWYEQTVSAMLSNQHFRLYGRDITERKRAEEGLEKTMAELRRSNDELQQFAYVASHDLQEPLRTIASFLQLIKRRYAGKLDADADDFIGFASDGATRMQNMIEGLLSYSRITTRAKPFESTDSTQAVKKAISNIKVAVDESHAEVTFDKLPKVVADGTQLAQLFQNLIANAINFRGKESPRIRVAAKQNGDELVFSVQDNGVGIPSEHQDRIFLLFERLHGFEYPGTGIGLAICKRIIERHGGRIWVESKPGEGSTFYFTLPTKVGEHHGR